MQLKFLRFLKKNTKIDFFQMGRILAAAATWTEEVIWMAEFTKLLLTAKNWLKQQQQNLKSALQKTPLAGHWKITTILIISTYYLLYSLGFDREVVYQLTAKTFLRLQKHKKIYTILKNITKWSAKIQK